jgi:hypothetical protein
VEKNPNTFDELVNEMNDLLDAKYERIHQHVKSSN